VYDTIARRAAEVVGAGHAAIVDAVYAPAADRDAIERVAAAARVPFVGIWLDAPESVLVARTERRRLDASDADATVIRAQLAQTTGAITWHRLDASWQPDEVLHAAAKMLRARLERGVVRCELQAA
jgi:predicted kinase